MLVVMSNRGGSFCHSLEPSGNFYSVIQAVPGLYIIDGHQHVQGGGGYVPEVVWQAMDKVRTVHKCQWSSMLGTLALIGTLPYQAGTEKQLGTEYHL